jgi:translation elongation factor aEF-1 beta
MAKVLVAIKVYPTSVDVDFNRLQQKIKEVLSEEATIQSFKTEPVAFGLNTLTVHILIPEQKSGTIQKIETKLQNLEEISQIQTLTATRI